MYLDMEEHGLLRRLDEMLRDEHVRSSVDPMVARVMRQLARNAQSVMAWEPVPLHVYGGTLPDDIRSSWVFVLRSETATGAERHPNSIQRMISYRGTGDLQTRKALQSAWRSNLLNSEPTQRIERRCLSIPTNVWHQAIAGDEHWVVVSFHTAATEELIEERPDPADWNKPLRRYYAVS